MKLNKFIFFLLVSSVTAAAFLYSCTKDKTPAPIEPCDPTKVYFQKDVLPLINSSCAKSGCHDAVTRIEGLNLSDYPGVMQIVKAGKPSGSELIEVISASGDDLMPPAPNSPLTQSQKDLIRRWISEGALNLSCTQDTANCNVINTSFANDIATIVNTNCLGCHSGSSIGGGVNLSGYTGVRAAATSGKLYNAVAQNGSAVSMPPSQKLSECDIRKIKSWIDAGSQNN